MDRAKNPMQGRTKRVYTARRLVISGVAALWMVAGLTAFFASGADDSAVAAAAVVPLVGVTVFWIAKPSL